MEVVVSICFLEVDGGLNRIIRHALVDVQKTKVVWFQ